MTTTQTTSKKLEDQYIDGNTMNEYAQMLNERMANMQMAHRAGAGMGELLLAELIMIECKLDAFMMMASNSGTDFTSFNQMMKEAAKRGQDVARMLRKQMREAADAAAVLPRNGQKVDA